MYQQGRTQDRISEELTRLYNEQRIAEEAANRNLEDLRNDPRYRVQQAPTRSADVAMNLAEQRIDAARDRALGGLSSLTMGSDPRFAGANIQRAIRAYDDRIGRVEDEGARTTTAAQKVIDDARYNAQELERQRQEKLKSFELNQAVSGLRNISEGISGYEALRTQNQGQLASDLFTLAGTMAGAGVGSAAKSTTGDDTGDDTSNNTTEQTSFGPRQLTLEEQTLQDQLAQTSLNMEYGGDDEGSLESLMSPPLTNDGTITPTEQIDPDLFEPFPLNETTNELGIDPTGVLAPEEPDPYEVQAYRSMSEGQEVDLFGGQGPLSNPEAEDETPVSNLGVITGRDPDVYPSPNPVTENEPFIYDDDFTVFNLDLRDQVGNPYLQGINTANPTPFGQDPSNLSINPETLPNSQTGVLLRTRRGPDIDPLTGLPRDLTYPAPPTYGRQMVYKSGGFIEADEGGVTEGEFSHKKNPIDIVQNGKKKGEMTGKELIFAPDDVNDMVAIIEEGDGDALIAYMKDLLEEDQFGFDFA